MCTPHTYDWLKLGKSFSYDRDVKGVKGVRNILMTEDAKGEKLLYPYEVVFCQYCNIYILQYLFIKKLIHKRAGCLRCRDVRTHCHVKVAV